MLVYRVQSGDTQLCMKSGVAVRPVARDTGHGKRRRRSVRRDNADVARVVNHPSSHSGQALVAEGARVLGAHDNTGRRTDVGFLRRRFRAFDSHRGRRVACRR